MNKELAIEIIKAWEDYLNCKGHHPRKLLDQHRIHAIFNGGHPNSGPDSVEYFPGDGSVLIKRYPSSCYLVFKRVMVVEDGTITWEEENG